MLEPGSPGETNEPLVSVLVPLFNGASTLERAIDSLRAQQQTRIEILVIDDGSSDAGPDLAARMADEDGRIRLLRQPSNGGPARARNRGLAEARGQWIGLLDADDAWDKGRLVRLLAVAEEADVVFDNLMGVDPHGLERTGPIFPQMPEEPLSVAALVAAKTPGTTYNLGYLKPLMRRSFLAENGLTYDEALRTGEDLVFYLEILLAGARTHIVRDPLYIYTMPVGHRSGRASTLSSTRPRDRELHAALSRVRQRHAARLNLQDERALDDRLAYLVQIAPVAEFHHARLTGRWARALRLLLSEPEVMKHVVRRLR